MTIDIITPDNQTLTIQKSYLNDALKKGARLREVGKSVNITIPNGQQLEIKTEYLSEALDKGATLTEPGIKEYGKAFLGGVGQKLGKLADTAVAGGALLAGSIGNPNPAAGITDDEEYRTLMMDTAKDYWNNPHLEHTFSKPFDTGMDDDPGIQVAKSSGDFVGELPTWFVGGAGVKVATKVGGIAHLPWIQKLNNFLKTDINLKNAASFAGAGAGAELAKSNDPDASEAEQIAREFTGAMIGGATLPALASKPAKALANLVTDPKGSFYSGLAKVYGGNKLNKEAIEAAQKLELQLTPQELSNSKLAHATQKYLLESMFAAESYKTVMENAPKKLLENLEDTFEKVGGKIAGTSEESALSSGMGQYKEFLKQRESEWRKQSTALYDKAKALAFDSDYYPETDEIRKKVGDLLYDLSHGLSKPEGDKLKVINKLDGMLQNLNNQTPTIRDLIQEITDLNHAAGEVVGYKELYKGIASTIENTVNNYKGSSEFVTAWQEAKKFNKEMIQTRVKTDIARSILREELPVDTLTYMNSAGEIKELGKIIGADLKGAAGENARILMNKLKRAKLEQYCNNKNIISAEGEFNATAFVNIFGKGADEDFLKELMGNHYKLVKENILPIATVLKNTRKSADPRFTTGKDWSALVGAASGLAGHAVLAKSSVSAMGSINIMSRIFADPAFARQIIARGKRLEKQGLGWRGTLEEKAPNAIKQGISGIDDDSVD